MSLLLIDGDPWFSTSIELSVVPAWVADVNGYYRDLGVSHRATRRELAEAYRSKHGDRSARLTYVFKQLLDPEVRYRYDRCPLGKVFYDRYVVRTVQQQIVRTVLEYGPFLDEPEVVERLARLLDSPISRGQDGGRSATRPNALGHGYFVLDTESGDPEVLVRWRQLLITEATKKGLSREIAVGFSGGRSAFEVHHDDGKVILFINIHDAPTQTLAAQAVASLVAASHPTEGSITMTDFDVDQFDFSGGYGTDVAKEKSKTGGPSIRLVEIFNLDGSTAGERSGANAMRVRFLNDYTKPRLHLQADDHKDTKYDLPWITVDMHTFVNTKPKPAELKENQKWPSKMTAVCRNSSLFKGALGSCWLCDHGNNGKKHNPTSRVWSLLVRREEVMEDGRLIGVRDATKEYQPIGEDGKRADEVQIVKDYYVVTQAWGNFYARLDGFGNHYGKDDEIAVPGYGTILDRDYTIKRIGTDTATDYQIVPEDPNYLPDGRKLDLRVLDIMEAQHPDMPDLRKLILQQASDEFFNRFFIPGNNDRTSSGGTSSAGPQVPASQSNPVTAEKLQQVRDRIAGRTSATAEQPSEQSSGSRAL